MKHFFPRILVKTKTKKRPSPTMEHLFSRIQVETCAQMHTPESNYWGDVSPPGFGTPGCDISLKVAVLPTCAMSRRWLGQLVTRFG